MDQKKIELIQSSFAKVEPIMDTAAEIFYARLFEIDPSAKNLFKGDMKEQGRKLMTMLQYVVNNLDNLEGIKSQVQDLGKRHVHYGVKADHYPEVGQALLDTLERGLGKDFTAEVKQAWAEAFETLSSIMIDAAKQEQEA